MLFSFLGLKYKGNVTRLMKNLTSLTSFNINDQRLEER